MPLRWVRGHRTSVGEQQNGRIGIGRIGIGRIGNGCIELVQVSMGQMAQKAQIAGSVDRFEGR
ncbi:MAG: hypothetical protein F2782_06685 [Actinobacteria bacterium]|nr:hypothetical protein [Actinomycetota bacterium]MSZ29833.1 hypothetical protein [Actinomycetota bacterium]